LVWNTQNKYYRYYTYIIKNAYAQSANSVESKFHQMLAINFVDEKD